MDDCRRHQVDRAHDGLNDVLDLMSEHESLDLSVGQNIGSHNQDGSMKTCMINLSKCTKQEKARYWYRVFGGIPTKRLAQMSKHQVIEGFGVADVDIGDEPVKHKGKFKRESFPRKYELTPLAEDITLAPCEQMYCDEVSGFTCETTDGATSAYIFACGSTGLEFTFLVKAKSNFYMVLGRMCKLADRYHWSIKTLHCLIVPKPS